MLIFLGNKKISDIAVIFDQVFRLKDGRSPKPVFYSKNINKQILDLQGPLFLLMRDSILKIEKVILKELGYEIYKI